MKKNLISVLILALMVVNIALTAIMMFSVMGSVKKTSALVTNIATVLNIELEAKEAAEDTGEVLIADSVTYDIGEELTILLRKSEGDDKSHYCLASVSLMMNSKHEDYLTYGETVSTQESVFKSIIVEVIGNHTLEEMQDDPEGVREEILKRIQDAYDSTFIYKVAFSQVIYQ